MKEMLDRKEKHRNKKLEFMMQSRFKKVEIQNDNYKKFGKFPSLQHFKKSPPKQNEVTRNWRQNFAIKLKNQSKAQSNRFFSMNKREGSSSKGSLYEKLLLNIQVKKQEVSLSENRKGSDFYFHNLKLSLQPSTISLSKNYDLDNSIEKVLRKLKDQRIRNFEKKYQINQQNKNLKAKTQEAQPNGQYQELKFNFNSLMPIQIIKSSQILSSKKVKLFEISSKRKSTGL